MRANCVLVAEDNPDDAFIFQTMIKRARLPLQLHFVGDGQQAIEWLAGEGNFSDRQKFPFPDVVFLDLKMPIKTGFEVLKWLRDREEFKDLPVNILSSSDDRRDLIQTLELGVTHYFVKSPQLLDVIEYLKGN